MLDDQEIRLRIKRLIVDRLLLDRVTADEIGDDDPLFGSGLDLDSVDGLELVLGLEQEFQFKIPHKTIKRDYFASVATLGQYVTMRLSEASAAGS